MSDLKTHIVIVGGGIVGFSAAIALLNQNYHVALIDDQLPQKADPWLRVSAIHLKTQQFFEKNQVWEYCRPFAVPYRGMHIWDERTAVPLRFDAQESGISTLGFIISNVEVLEALKEACLRMLNFHYYPQKTFKTYCKKNNDIVVTLNDNTLLTTDLLIAADGAKSRVRECAGISIKRTIYDQCAVVATWKCEKPHQNIATQIFLDQGPLAALPLQDSKHISMVWSTDPVFAGKLLNAPAAFIEQQVENAFAHMFGKMHLQNTPKVFPLLQHNATHYVKDSVVLIGDAAHVVHPLAGLGLNLGIGDVDCFSEIVGPLRLKRSPLFYERDLKRFARERRFTVKKMQLILHGIQKSFSQPSGVLRFAGRLSLAAAAANPLIRQFLKNTADKT